MHLYCSVYSSTWHNNTYGIFVTLSFFIFSTSQYFLRNFTDAIDVIFRCVWEVFRHQRASRERESSELQQPSGTKSKTKWVPAKCKGGAVFCITTGRLRLVFRAFLFSYGFVSYAHWSQKYLIVIYCYVMWLLTLSILFFRSVLHVDEMTLNGCNEHNPEIILASRNQITGYHASHFHPTQQFCYYRPWTQYTRYY